MTLRRAIAIGAICAGWAVGAVGNTPPVMEDRYYATYQGQAVTIEMVAEDLDINPMVPGDHPLTFSIIDGPELGLLVGDLRQVAYRSPHEAVVEMVYIPADGVVGTEVITFIARDPLGETALGVVTISILPGEQRSRGVLSGIWTTRMTYNAQTQSFTALTTQYTQVYRVESLTLKGIADVRMESVGGVKTMVFDSLRFEADLSLSGVDHISTLRFDPKSAPGFFDSWLASTRFSLGDVSFSHLFLFRESLTDSYQSLLISGVSGAVRLSNLTRLELVAGCGFQFSRNTTSLMWKWCDIDWRAVLVMQCSGFGSFTVQANDVPVPISTPWGDTVTASAELVFDLDEGKSFSAELHWRPLRLGCVQLYTDLTDIADPTIYGFRIECDIPGEFGSIRLVSATSFDPLYNARVTGQSDYFELLRLSGPLQSCCTPPGSWSMATYFYDGASTLFDWGMTIFRIDVRVAAQFDFLFETILRSGEFGDPPLELMVGWTTRW